MSGNSSPEFSTAFAIGFPRYSQVMKLTRISLEEYRFSVSTVAFNGVF